MTSASASRDRILARLRAGPKPFPDAPSAPDIHQPVCRIEATDPEATLARFRAETEALKGTLTVCNTAEAAISAVLNLVGTAKSALIWDDLPLPGLVDALAAHGVQTRTPPAQDTQDTQDTQDRAGLYRALDRVEVGITGADAGLATTGTLILTSRPGQSRIASLLPPVHIALLRRERLFTHLEAWTAAEGRAALTESRGVVFIAGPSKTGDIEMNIIHGVHGPKHVHVVMW